jgi:hypothetical protein
LTQPADARIETLAEPGHRGQRQRRQRLELRARQRQRLHPLPLA